MLIGFIFTFKMMLLSQAKKLKGLKKNLKFITDKFTNNYKLIKFKI